MESDVCVIIEIVRMNPNLTKHDSWKMMCVIIEIVRMNPNLTKYEQHGK